MTAAKTSKTAHTQLISVRLPFEMIDALKEAGEKRERPWQTVMKEIISDSLGLSGDSGTKKTRATERQLYAAPHVKASSKRLKTR